MPVWDRQGGRTPSRTSEVGAEDFYRGNASGGANGAAPVAPPAPPQAPFAPQPQAPYNNGGKGGDWGKPSPPPQINPTWAAPPPAPPPPQAPPPPAPPAPPQTQPAAQPAPAINSQWTAYLTANADVQTSWGGLTPEEQALFGSPEAYAEWHWNTSGQTEGRPGGPEQFAQQDVLDEIDSGPLARIARDQLDVGNQYADWQNQAEEELNAGYFNDANVQAGRNEASTRGIADDAYYAEVGDADAARADLERTGADAYSGRMGLLDEDYAQAQGFTDNEISAWERVAADERRRNENTVKADFGISGQYGKAVRNLGELGEEYGANRALYEGGRRREDYGSYATGRYAAYGDLSRVNEDASRGYSGARTAATGNRNNAYAGAGQAFNDYTSQNLAQLYGGNQAASRAYWGQVNNNQDNYTVGLTSNYQDWLSQRNRASDMGFNAAQLAANAGQVATNNINTATGNAADAYSASLIARGNNTQRMWNNIGETAGNAFGSFKWGGGGGGKP